MVCRDGADGDVVAEDVWAAVASAYDVFAVPHEPARRAALDELVPLLRPDCGPILDVGAGSGASVAVVLDRLPTASVVALEPSRAMRSLLLSRIAARTAWFPRVTVRPEDFFSATLPPRLGGAILLGVVGCFDAGERAAVLAELATRCPPGVRRSWTCGCRSVPSGWSRVSAPLRCSAVWSTARSPKRGRAAPRGCGGG